MSETASPAPAPRTIGQRLRAGRERSGLSVAATAEKLHLDIKVIEALEADRFSELGASVYVRGHLRRYADFVGEPGIELVSIYTEREVRPPPPDLTQAPHPEHRVDTRRLVTPLVGLGCALVLAFAIWWVLAGSRAGIDHSTATATPGESLPAASVPENTPAVATPVPSVQVASNPANAHPGASMGAETAPPPRADSASVRSTKLRLVLNGESWVEVYDSRNERLFYDVASAGSVQSIEGRPPLRVVLGNAAAVSVQVDGQAREIPASAVDGEGARFVVNRSGSLARARQ